MSAKVILSLDVNGERIERLVEPRDTLADFLRSEGLTGVHVGCAHGVCGSCTIRVNGDAVRSCLTLAVQCQDADVETIEGATASGRIADIQAAFVQNTSLQCGFCTPGMLMSVDELLAENPNPTRDEIREHLSGNYCRCTGYQAIVDAVEEVAEARAKEGRAAK